MEHKTENREELRSGRIRKILNEKPAWAVRWGITIVFVLSAILFVLFILFRPHLGL